MASRRAWFGRLSCVALAAFLAACSTAGTPAATQPARVAAPSGSLEPTATGTERPCPTPAASPAQEASLPSDLDEATREAVRIRTEYGLRRDLAWIRKVAGDPTATSEFGTPLLPAEGTSLFARNELAPPVRSALDRYGHIDELGGFYIDNAAGGVPVVLWTTDPTPVETAIRGQLPPCHPFAVRQVRWPEIELRRWQDTIAADVDWMASIPALAVGISVDVIENMVEVDISSSVVAAPQRVVDHYDAPAGMIHVISDGTGAYLLPGGTVVGRVLLADGTPPGPNGLVLDAGSPDDAPGWCGAGDVGYGVVEDGTFEYPCKAGRRTILVRALVPGGEGYDVIASAVVDVPAGGSVQIEIRLPTGFDPTVLE